MIWFDFWLRSLTTAHGLQVAYWSALTREASEIAQGKRG